VLHTTVVSKLLGYLHGTIRVAGMAATSSKALLLWLSLTTTFWFEISKYLIIFNSYNILYFSSCIFKKM
jgi:hypothetical protein